MALQEQFRRLKETGPRAINFFSEVWAEMKKAHWPTRKETYAATMVVVGVTVLIAVFLGVVDFALSHMVPALLSRNDHPKPVVRRAYVFGLRAQGEGRARRAHPNLRQAGLLR